MPHSSSRGPTLRNCFPEKNAKMKVLPDNLSYIMSCSNLKLKHKIDNLLISWTKTKWTNLVSSYHLLIFFQSRRWITTTTTWMRSTTASFWAPASASVSFPACCPCPARRSCTWTGTSTPVASLPLWRPSKSSSPSLEFQLRLMKLTDEAVIGTST